jgi:hypothetical protein
MDDERLLGVATVAASMTFTADVAPRIAAAGIAEIAEITSASCIATRLQQLNRIITRVYEDSMRPLGITASQFRRREPSLRSSIGQGLSSIKPVFSGF